MKEKPARYRQPNFNSRVNLVRREGNIYSEAPQRNTILFSLFSQSSSSQIWKRWTFFYHLTQSVKLQYVSLSQNTEKWKERHECIALSEVSAVSFLLLVHLLHFKAFPPSITSARNQSVYSAKWRQGSKRSSQRGQGYWRDMKLILCTGVYYEGNEENTCAGTLEKKTNQTKTPFIFSTESVQN